MPTFQSICLAVVALALPCAAQATPASLLSISFEDLPATSPLQLTDQYAGIGIRFNSTAKSYMLGPNAPGVSTSSGVRSLSPDDTEPEDIISGFRRPIEARFTSAINFFSVYLTDSVGQQNVLQLSALAFDGSVMYTIESTGVSANDGDLPSLSAISGIGDFFGIRLRVYDSVNNNVPSAGTSSFEVDDFTFGRLREIPEPDSVSLALAGAVLLSFARRRVHEDSDA